MIVSSSQNGFEQNYTAKKACNNVTGKEECGTKTVRHSLLYISHNRRNRYYRLRETSD